MKLLWLKILILVFVILITGAGAIFFSGYFNGVQKKDMIFSGSEQAKNATSAPLIKTQSLVSVPILMYHHVALKRPQSSYYVSPETFDDQMAWLKDNGYQVISYDAFYQALANQGELPAKAAVITFDDGNLNQYINAYPILKKYGYSATFFVTIKYLDQPGFMTWKMLKEMSANGMTIASHTYTHRLLTKLDDNTVYQDMKNSKDILEKELGKPVVYLAYPGGDYNTSTISMAKKAGYLSALSTRHGIIHDYNKSNYFFKFQRVHIDDELPSFIDWVQGKNLK